MWFSRQEVEDPRRQSDLAHAVDLVVLLEHAGNLGHKRAIAPGPGWQLGRITPPGVAPSRAELGGVGRRSRETVRLCESAGFDLVLIETVGVGQSETVVAELSDLFLLLLAPAGGDELQGVKRGIMEMADLILVNKADGDLKPAAARTCGDYAGALRLLRRRPQDPDGYPKAMMVSALDHSGMTEAWADMQHLAAWRRETGHWTARRADQARHWFHEEVRQGLLAALTQEPARGILNRLGDEVAAGRATPEAAAAEMLGLLGR